MRVSYLLVASVVMLLPLAAMSGADIMEMGANFDGGNTDTMVDAYVGMPGDGWTTAWKLPLTAQNAGATVLSPGDAGFNEVKPGSGSYLAYTATGTTSGAGSSTLTRKYNDTVFGVDLTTPHTIEFTVRIDEIIGGTGSTFTNYADRYYIYDNPLAPTGSNSDCRWLISAYGAAGSAATGSVGQWSFYDGLNNGTLSGDNNLSTGIMLETGGVYDFTINVDPTTQSYDATVSNGTTSFSATDLGWRTSGTSSGGYLGFNMRNSNSSDTRAMSLDNIRITQDGWFPPGGMTAVSAHFDGGNTDTMVDAYTGMAGDGWGGGWTRMVTTDDPNISGNSTVVSPGNTGFVELAPGEGAYLSNTLSIAPEETARVQASVTRNYATSRPGIDFTQEHTISFKVRIDEDIDGAGSTFTAFDDRYYLFDAPTKSAGPGSTTSWLISAFGDTGAYGGGIVGEWTFYDGANNGSLYDGDNIDTDMALTAGGVYEFTITIDPETQTYDATVSDGTDSFTATDLGWRTAAANIGGNITFATWGIEGGDDRAFSIDSIEISQVPEPSTMLMGILALASLTVLGLRRRS